MGHFVGHLSFRHPFLDLHARRSTPYMICHMANISGEIVTINKTPTQRTQCAQAYTVFELPHHITRESFCHSFLILSLISLPLYNDNHTIYGLPCGDPILQVTPSNKNIGGYTNDRAGVYTVFSHLSL